MRQEKQLLLNEIKEKIDSSNSFIITRYQQLEAKSITDFRRAIASKGGNFEVVKKRVFIKAAETSGITFDKDTFDGHIGIVFAGSDSIEVTKAVYAFSKENTDKVFVLAGFFDGKLYTSQDVETLSKLPGMNEMRAQLLGLLEAPMAQTLGTMDALLSSVIHCLQNKAKKEEENQ